MVAVTQLIEDVRMLFRGSSASAEANGTDADPLATLPLTAGPAFTDALKLRSTASKDLILHLLSRASPPPGTAPDVDEFRARCRELTAETVASRAALGVADGRIKQLQDSLEQAEDRLRRAEKRLDRERSKIVRQVEGKPSTSASAGEGTSAAGEASTSAATGEDRPDAAKVAAEGVKSEGASDDERGINGRVVKKDPDGPVAIVNGVDPAELEGARDAAEASARELEAMKGVLSERTTELDNLKFRVHTSLLSQFFLSPDPPLRCSSRHSQNTSSPTRTSTRTCSRSSGRPRRRRSRLKKRSRWRRRKRRAIARGRRSSAMPCWCV